MDRLVYLQLWNEPGDPRDFVEMEVYADYLVAAYAAVHQVEDNVAATYTDIAGTFKVMTPGQNNYDDWNRAFNHNPNAKFAFDVWASHPYPEAYPPHYNHHDGVGYFNRIKTIDSYVFDLDACAQPHGPDGKTRRGIPVMITETGNGDHLGISYEGYPKTTWEMAGQYFEDAWKNYWYEWPEIVTVHPFILANLAWNHFAFVDGSSGSVDSDGDGWLEPTFPHQTYTDSRAAVAEMVSSGKMGSVELTPYRGPKGSLRGLITSGGSPLNYVTIFTDGHEYGHVSAFDGIYEVHDVPAATYSLTAHKYGYQYVSKTVLAYVLIRFIGHLGQWKGTFRRLFTLLRGVLFSRLDAMNVMLLCGTARGSPRMVGSPQQVYLPGFVMS